RRPGAAGSVLERAEAAQLRRQLRRQPRLPHARARHAAHHPHRRGYRRRPAGGRRRADERDDRRACRRRPPVDQPPRRDGCPGGPVRRGFRRGRRLDQQQRRRFCHRADHRARRQRPCLSQPVAGAQPGPARALAAAAAQPAPAARECGAFRPVHPGPTARRPGTCSRHCRSAHDERRQRRRRAYAGDARRTRPGPPEPARPLDADSGRPHRSGTVSQGRGRMTFDQVEIQLIAAVAATACALPGAFLVLRRMAMMSDAISHTVLLGIVVAFFIVEDLNSPLLITGAALTSVLTVSLVELLNRTRLVREDAAIGLVFPALFSIAVILISRYAGDVHLDTDAVLLGELALAPFERFRPFGVDIGPVSLYVMAGILLLNLLFIAVFYKELKLSTFDAGLAAALGFSRGLIHYALMTLVSVTAVGAFDTVGSIIVVALIIAPPVSAYLLTDSLPRLLGLSVLIGVASAIAGYWLAHFLDASISGAMATTAGLIFLVVLLF